MLDTSLPYGEVFGIPGARFVQEGRYYRVDGMPVAIDEDGIARPVEGAVVAIAAAPAEATNDGDQHSMSNQQLRAMVQIAGGEWRGRAAALQFLEGQPA